MNRLFAILITFGSFFSLHAEEKVEAKKHKVGLCIMATGRYDVYAQSLVESARPHFCTQSEVTYFVFTDGNISPANDVVKIYQKRLGWPHDTLKRFKVYDTHRALLGEMDYLFALDADMRFVGSVGEEILSDRVATQHPGFIGSRGTYETNPISTAYVGPKEGEIYFAGGFYGGSSEEFFKFIHHANEQIEKDEAKQFIAIWHDESHLNRYFIDHPPTRILSPAYCYPENWRLPYPKKLLALDKNHAELRK